MGTDDLHFKRKQRSLNTLARKESKRKPYDVVLVVCEGTTETNYFKALWAYLKLNPANIDIKVCPQGNDPVTIVTFALDEHKFNGYDQIYCVFDKEHKNYQDALGIINFNSQKNKIPIHAITSVPCFEYWLLLHYEDTTRPYNKKGKKSTGDQLKSELKKYIKNYNEADKDIFEKTKSNLKQAIGRARQIDKAQERNCTDNPSTSVYRLVEYLMAIKSK